MEYTHNLKAELGEPKQNHVKAVIRAGLNPAQVT